MAYSVKNLGLGPAIIKDRYFIKGKTRFKPTGASTDEVSEFLESVLGHRVQYHLKLFGLPGKDAAIPSQSEVVIADIDFPAVPQCRLDVIEAMAGEVSFQIRYESLYGESFDLKVVSNIGR